jgi:hypothetical protein
MRQLDLSYDDKKISMFLADDALPKTNNETEIKLQNAWLQRLAHYFFRSLYINNHQKNSKEIHQIYLSNIQPINADYHSVLIHFVLKNLQTKIISSPEIMEVQESETGSLTFCTLVQHDQPEKGIQESKFTDQIKANDKLRWEQYCSRKVAKPNLPAAKEGAWRISLPNIIAVPGMIVDASKTLVNKARAQPATTPQPAPESFIKMTTTFGAPARTARFDEPDAFLLEPPKSVGNRNRTASITHSTKSAYWAAHPVLKKTLIGLAIGLAVATVAAIIACIVVFSAGTAAPAIVLAAMAASASLSAPSLIIPIMAGVVVATAAIGAIIGGVTGLMQQAKTSSKKGVEEPSKMHIAMQPIKRNKDQAQNVAAPTKTLTLLEHKKPNGLQQATLFSHKTQPSTHASAKTFVDFKTAVLRGTAMHCYKMNKATNTAINNHKGINDYVKTYGDQDRFENIFCKHIAQSQQAKDVIAAVIQSDEFENFDLNLLKKSSIYSHALEAKTQKNAQTHR